MMYIRIYCLRHGETNLNSKGLLQGWLDEPLNAVGIAAAQATEKGLKKAEIRFDRVYSSPLIRAMETARIVTGEEPMADLRLKEISFGQYEGHYYPNLSCPIPCPDGESLEQVEERVGAFIDDLISDPSSVGKHILISTHGMTIKAMLTVLGHYDHPMKVPAHGNCAFTIVDIDPGKGNSVILKENVCFY